MVTMKQPIPSFVKDINALPRQIKVVRRVGPKKSKNDRVRGWDEESE